MSLTSKQQPQLLGRYRQLAPTASVRVSPLCLGSMSFGTTHAERYGTCDKATSFAILDLFYSNGGNFIDTANAYRDEQSEMWLGEWMAERGNRDDIVLATKYSSDYLAYQDVKHANYGGNGVKSMKLSLQASLKKLQTTYVDIFYVHWWDYSASIPEVMHGLNDLVVSGQVLYLGISDTPAWVVSKANQYARDHGLRPFVVYQGMYNAGMRDMESDIIPMCQDEGMGLAIYGALNQGRFQTAAEFKRREEDASHGGRNFKPTSEHDKQISRGLEIIAEKKGEGVGMLSVALAYVMQKNPYVFPIVGGRKVEHLAGNIEALQVSLSQSDIDEIDSMYDFNPGFPHTFLSGSMFDGSRPRGTNHPGGVFLTKLSGPFDWVDPLKPIGRK